MDEAFTVQQCIYIFYKIFDCMVEKERKSFRSIRIRLVQKHTESL